MELPSGWDAVLQMFQALDQWWSRAGGFLGLWYQFNHYVANTIVYVIRLFLGLLPQHNPMFLPTLDAVPQVLSSLVVFDRFVPMLLLFSCLIVSFGLLAGSYIIAFVRILYGFVPFAK